MGCSEDQHDHLHVKQAATSHRVQLLTLHCCRQLVHNTDMMQRVERSPHMRQIKQQ
jgi:hypothetical protein